MSGPAARLAWCCCVALLAAGCDRAAPVAETPKEPPPEDDSRAALPELPSVNISKMDRQVREQIEEARRALADNPLSPKLTGRLGMLYHVYGLREPAKVCYQRAALLNPRAFRWQYYLGWVLAELGEEQAGIRAFLRVVELRPDYMPVYVALGELYTSSGDLDLAEQALGKVLAWDENYAVPHACLGRTAAKRKDYAAAVEHFEKALSIAEGAQVHYALAMAYRMLDRREEAVEHLRLSQEVPGELPHRDPLKSALDNLEIGGFHELTKGLDRLAAGDLEGAVAHFETVIRVKPELAAGAHYGLGNVRYRQGDYARAAHHYRESLSIRPRDHQTLHNLGATLIRQGLYDQAVACFRQVLELRPHEALANVKLAEALLHLGETNSAIEQYGEALEKDPALTTVHRELARALSANENWDEAVVHWRAYVQSFPEDVSALVELASALARAGEAAEAERIFDRALESAPDGDSVEARRDEVLAASDSG